MYFSINRFTGDGVTTQWEFNFAGGYISQDHVKARVTDETGAVTQPALSWVGPNTVSIIPAVANGHQLEIYRDTPKNVPLVDYTNGAIVSEKNLDTTAEQSVFVAAEVVDRFADTEATVVDATLVAVEAAELSAVAANSASVNAAAAQEAALNAAADASTAQISLANIEEDLDALAGGDFSSFLRAPNNLADLTDPSTARQNIGLGYVDNTPDINKPVSTAQAAAIAASSNFQQTGAGAVIRPAQDKLREWVSVKDFGAVGDGVVNDTAAISAAMAASTNGVLLIPGGGYAITSGTLAAGGSVVGYGSHSTTIRRTGTGNLINAADRDGDRISGVTLDLDRGTLGNVAGHGISASGNGLTFSDVSVVGYGSDGVGGGTGILVVPGTLSATPEVIRMTDCNFRPDPAASISVGWLYADAVYSFASRIYTDGVVGGIGYAHELKDNAQFNSLDQLIASDSNVALAYGQMTAGVDGADYNVATNIVAARCDGGLLIGEGFGNVTVGMVHVPTGSPGNIPRNAVSFVGGANQNYAGAVSAFGLQDETVRIAGGRNTAEVCAHDTSPTVALFDAGSAKNFVNIVHPGTRTTVRGNITDSSGNAINSANANVVHSPVTGERIGSVQGRFWDKLGESGATPISSHNWVYESGSNVFLATLTPGASGNISGFSVNTARDGQNEGRLWHVTGATRAENYWTVAVGGSTDVIRIYSNHIRLGAIGPRWHSGTGSPEGVVTAPVGSFYSRTDGGAGTSFYVKESGTGNTGWVAK